MNVVILMGRLTRDAEIRETQTTTVARLTLAVDRKYKKEGEQSADFIGCVAFGKTAEFIQKYLHKGTKVVIEGRWQTGSYTNKEGQKVYTNDCVIESVEFAESKKADDAQSSPDGADDFMNQDIDEEMPFGKLPV